MKLGSENPKGNGGASGHTQATAGPGASNKMPNNAGGNGTKFNTSTKMPNSKVSGKGSNHWQAKNHY